MTKSNDDNSDFTSGRLLNRKVNFFYDGITTSA